MITSNEPEPVEVLNYPYPYQAAFTVASDIDSASIDRFRAVHALFCEREAITENSLEWKALGLTPNCTRFNKDRGGVPGLGLDFADSFFLVGDPTTFGLYRYLPGEDSFCEDHQGGENCANLVRQWLKTGAIDSYHTFLHYKRHQVEPLLRKLFDWCEQEGVSKPSVWINHSAPVTPSGLCPEALQPSRTHRVIRWAARNLTGGLFGPKRWPFRYAFVRYDGDTPGSPYYVNDLLAANGLRYVWLNAQDLSCDQIAVPQYRLNQRSTILQAVTLDDGVRYYQFQRCSGKPPDGSDTNAYLRDSELGFDSSTLITEKNLDELCRRNGACILYTHWTHFRSLPISDETMGRFELLQSWRDAGKIWVTSTAKLLEWTRRRTFLEILFGREGNHLVVEIEGVDDPIFGRESLSLKDLDGLCLRLRQPEASITLAINGQRLSSEQLCRSGDLCWVRGGGDSKRGAHQASGCDAGVNTA